MQLLAGSPIPDWELWACASKLLADHGDHAKFHAAERFDAMVAADDRPGALTWINIGLCLVALTVVLPSETRQ